MHLILHYSYSCTCVSYSLWSDLVRFCAYLQQALTSAWCLNSMLSYIHEWVLPTGRNVCRSSNHIHTKSAWLKNSTTNLFSQVGETLTYTKKKSPNLTWDPRLWKCNKWQMSCLLQCALTVLHIGWYECGNGWQRHIGSYDGTWVLNMWYTVDTSIEIICLTTLWTGPVTCIYMYIIHTFSCDYDVMYT